MFRSLEEPSVFKKALTAVFLVCFAYWGYLFFASQMIIDCDALGYQKLGSWIYKEGWVKFFEKGPQREPLYPLIVAISMRIADIFSISYHIVQKFIHITFLFVSQLLILKLLTKLKVKNIIKLITIFYFGFSPAIVNSAFCLYSEIFTYPFVLAIVLVGTLSWRAIYKLKPLALIAGLGLCTSVLFVLLTFCKAIFQSVFLFFLIPYFCILINSIIRKDKAILLRSVVFIAIMVLVLNSFVIQYKLLNKKFNGRFVFAEYAYILYGTAVKRANPLTPRILLAHLASIPGEGVASLFFTGEECKYTGWEWIDYYGYTMWQGLLREERLGKRPEGSTNPKLLSMAYKKIMEKPYQYLLFMLIQAVRVPFWESTRLGFVGYPAWLANLFGKKIFRYPLRFTLSLLTYLSIFSLTARVFKKRKLLLFGPQSNDDGAPIICFFMLLIIFSFAGLHSFIYVILARYPLPMAPLYLICIAYFLHSKIYAR